MDRLTCTAIGIPFFLSLVLLAQAGIPAGLAKARADFDAATSKADKGALERLLVDDFTWVDRSGGLRDKKTVLQELQPSSNVNGSVEGRIYPGGAIVISTRRASANGPVINRGLQVWLEQAGTWKLAAHQGVPADPKEKVPPATAASSPLPPNAGAAADIKAIETAIESLAAGNQRGDAKNFAASVTDQFVGVSVNGFASKQRVEALSKAPQAAQNSTLEQSSTRVYGDIAVTNQMFGSQSGGTVMTIVHVKQNGKWLRAGIAFAPRVGAK